MSVDRLTTLVTLAPGRVAAEIPGRFGRILRASHDASTLSLCHNSRPRSVSCDWTVAQAWLQFAGGVVERLRDDFRRAGLPECIGARGRPRVRSTVMHRLARRRSVRAQPARRDESTPHSVTLVHCGAHLRATTHQEALLPWANLSRRKCSCSTTASSNPIARSAHSPARRRVSSTLLAQPLVASCQ
jgi:hypothetical protein